MVTAYIACRMTGRDRSEQVKRARYVCAILRQYGIDPISPVLAENVKDEPGPLINDDRARLAGFWKRDKEIIRYEAHVILIDGAHEKSFGVEREYSLSRWLLWKPTVLLMPKLPLTVVDFEDDYVAHTLEEAGEYIRANYGTFWKRVVWRVKMLSRCLPKFIFDQLYQFR